MPGRQPEVVDSPQSRVLPPEGAGPAPSCRASNPNDAGQATLSTSEHAERRQPTGSALRPAAISAYVLGTFTSVGALFLALHSVKRWHVPGRNDFNVFYTAGKLVNGGHASAVYVNQTVFAAEGGVSGGHHFHMPFVNPPDFALMMALFAHVPFLPSYYLWTALNAAAFLLAGLIAVFHLPSRLRVPGVLLLTGCLPIVVAVTQGQVSGVVALGFTLSLQGFRRPALLLPGIVLLSIKPQLAVVILAVVVVRRSRPEWASAAAGLLIAAAMGMAAGGVEAYGAFVRQSLHMAGTTTGVHWDAADNFSILSQLQTFLGYGAASRVGWALSSIALLGAFLWVLFGRRGGSDHAAASTISVPWLACAATTVLIANHLQYHDLTLLYPAAIVALGSRQYKVSLAVLAAVWLDPALYPVTHLHVVVVACAVALAMWGLAEYRHPSPAATMDGNTNWRDRGHSWKSLRQRRWGSASESGTPSMS